MKNKILKTVTTIAGITFMVAGSCLDSYSYIPHVICLVSLAWLSLMAIANREALNEY